MSAVSGMIRAMAASPRVYLADPEQNAQEIAALLKKADELGAHLCVFPELCLTGATCGDLLMQPTLLRGALEALKALIALPVQAAFVVSLPLELGGRVCPCAAVIRGHQALIIPKTHTSGVPQGTVIPGIPQARVMLDPVIDCGLFTLGVELGEGYALPHAPSDDLALRGATIIANPCAAAEQMGMHAKRESALRAQSSRLLCGYVHVGAGYGESTTDLVFAGHAGIYECGELLAQNPRFARESSYAIADIDVERLRYRRSASPAFLSGSAGEPSSPAVLGESDAMRGYSAAPLLRPLAPLPFLPEDGERASALCDALDIQAQGLIRRMSHIRTQKLVVGVSGGLDSTLALLSAAYAYDLAGWDRKGIVGITMPGFGTGSRTKGNADLLMAHIGCTTLTIPIGPAVTQHFADIGQSADVHDICYENSQARERTQIVMDYANKIGALALGTGDLSELALGWCTYNGDHMSMYNMNGSVPKTLMRAMVAHAAGLLGEQVAAVAADILDTPVSPELLPVKEGELTQRTEDKLGAYELHDFFLWHMMDGGAGPQKLYALACQAFDGRYAREAILSALRTFIRRFFTQQFKRSAMPDGPQVTPVSLSPRGGYAMPCDAQMALWLKEADAIAPKA